MVLNKLAFLNKDQLPIVDGYQIGRIHGTCDSSDVWTSTTIADLNEKIPYLDCIFAAGLATCPAPTDGPVATGYMSGQLLAPVGLPEVNPIANPAYYGDFGYNIDCWNSEDEQYELRTFGNLVIAAQPAGFSRWTLGVPSDLFGEHYGLFKGEAPMPEGGAFLMDFTADPSKECPQRAILGDNTVHRPGFFPSKPSPPPIAGYKDLCALMFWDEVTHEAVWLCKAMALLPKGDYATVLWYALEGLAHFSDSHICDFTQKTNSGTFEFDYWPIENAARGLPIGLSNAVGQGLKDIKRTVSAASIKNYLVDQGNGVASLVKNLKGIDTWMD